LLCQVNIPNALFDNNGDCSAANTNVIDDYNDAVMECVKVASRTCIPGKLCSSNASSYVTPGWSDYVKDKHLAARDASLEWTHFGRPRICYDAAYESPI